MVAPTEVKASIISIPVLVFQIPPLSLSQKIGLVAIKYNVSPEILTKVIQCESFGSSTVQSYVVTNGIREDSWGLAQIHLSAHPEVTKAQALNVDFSLDFLASNLAKGQGNMWTCFRNLSI